MRVVSWLIVTASLAALVYNLAFPVLQGFGLPPMVNSQVAGTAVAANLPLNEEVGEEEIPVGFAGQYRELARNYTSAWCSQDAASVAAFFAADASLQINDAEPAVGTNALAEATQVLMTAFPDLQVTMDGLEEKGDMVIYHWTLNGTNNGPDGNGKRVRISGYEVWEMNGEGLIAHSSGHFDTVEYERQLAQGYQP